MINIYSFNKWLQNTRVIGLNVYIEQENFDSCSILFIDKNNYFLRIIETTCGIIKNNEVLLSSLDGYTQCYIEAPNSEYIECVFSFFKDKEFSYSKTERVEVNRHIENSISEKHDEDNKYIYYSPSSEWLADILLKEDLEIIFTKRGKKSKGCIGNMSEYITYSDFVFDLDPKTEKTHVPLDIVNRYLNYDYIYVFEIYKPHDISLSNFYKKNCISNKFSIGIFN